MVRVDKTLERKVSSELFSLQTERFSASNELGKEIQKKSSSRSLGIRFHQISLYPSLLVFSLPPNPPSCLEIASLLYPGTYAHQWPRKSEFLMLPFCKRRPRYAAAYPRPLESANLVHCSVGLHAAVKRYAAAWSASLLCTRGSTAALLFVFSTLVLFFYYSDSFFIRISPCPIKYYSMGD